MPASILDQFVNIAPYLNQLFLEDCHVCIADTEKFIVSIPGKHLQMKIKPGDPIVAGTSTERAIRENRRIVAEGNRELYGVAYFSICVPLNEGEKVVGCIAIGVSTEKNSQIAQAAQSLAAMVEQLTASTRSISEASQQLAAAIDALSDMSVAVNKQMDEINEVTRFVSQVASQTNLLGLNAAIQAAHAGEHGRGFSVVAQEIRHLADRSNESAKKIAEQLKEIQTLTNSMLQNIQTSSGLTQENAAAIEELAASVDELNMLAQNLAELSKLREEK